jgi:outer membrane protein OmpA-like peptidoglycan-associated protein
MYLSNWLSVVFRASRSLKVRTRNLLARVRTDRCSDCLLAIHWWNRRVWLADTNRCVHLQCWKGELFFRAVVADHILHTQVKAGGNSSSPRNRSVEEVREEPPVYAAQPEQVERLEGTPNIEQQLTQLQERLRYLREHVRHHQGGLAATASARTRWWTTAVVILLMSILLVCEPSIRVATTRKPPNGVSATAGTIRHLFAAAARTFSTATDISATSLLMRLWPTAADGAAASTDAPGRDLRIYFDFGRDTLRPESEPVLKEMADMLSRHPDWKMSLAGHTDNIGPNAYNQDLSNRRAAAAKRTLVKKYHVAADQLTAEGFGAKRPKESNETRIGRAHNRRVELVGK